LIIEHFLEYIVPYITSSLELIGVAIIAIAAVRGLVQFFRNGFDFRGDDVAIDFAKAMTLSLEFKLAAEIIKTVVIRTIDEFIILASVAILRVVLSFVLHWELKTGAKNVDTYCPDPDDLAIDPADISIAPKETIKTGH